MLSFSLKADYFYPRPPRGGRPLSPGFVFLILSFLAPPPAWRATLIGKPYIVQHILFLSTPSARRATGITMGGSGAASISIHALREEGDF